MSTFGNVHGPVNTGSGNQFVAGRDQYLAGRDQHIGGAAPQLTQEIDRLREALDELRLTGAERKAAEARLDEAERALPDKAAAGSHLQRFAAGLRDAGALATAGTALVTSMRALGALVGLPLI
ncbi:hypothetical protein JIG36_23490 [Actinoplanes sp. LDG1-06]|uniref:Uncharacterized protein n=1 Tax=Paractinoplanes ovalisporus TaxID=2810368 RepID=A0ABS2AFD0_9ACTN|nr:hypothetical protein [Actinoplanes ovalisporus]MBM2618524.1 hypothetical protein [Actinoplanes ovalisporus]